jgi:hypothetical protein
VSKQIDLSRVSARVVLATAIALLVAVAALLGRIGSDAEWLAALGHVVVHRHAIPDGVPFAATSTAHWSNPLVLAELIFDALRSALGVRGLMDAQLVATAGGLALLARGARDDGAGAIGTGAALLIAGVGSMPSLAITRVQLFSLVLFPALLMLLRAETRRPSMRIWWAVPLLALWSNLHGAALLGLAVTGGYLVFGRGRRDPWLATVVLLACAAALCLNPAGLHIVDYYRGVLTNAAAQRGTGEWGALSLAAPLDVVLVLSAVLLLWRAWRARPPLWEAVVLVALAVLTIRADRNGVWLLMVAVAPAARELDPARSLRTLAPIAAVLAVVVLVVSLARGPAPAQASPAMVGAALALAHGSPVLASGAMDEQVAVAGGRIWAGDPIDAFSHRVQVDYLDWLAGDRAGERAVTPAVRVALVAPGSAPQRLMARMDGFVVARRSATAVLYVRVAR